MHVRARCGKRWGLIASAVVLLCGGDNAAWAFGFSVDPARVELTVPAGQRRGQTLKVKNARTDAPIHLKVYVRDVIFLPDGTHEFPPPGGTDWSCADWVDVIPDELEVPPQSSGDVRVSVSTPPNAQGGHYAMVFFETGPSYAEKGIGVNFRVGTLVEAVIPGTERYDVKLKDLAFEAPSTFRVDLFNGGNLLVRPRGTLKLFDADGKKIRQLPFNEHQLGVLPKTLRDFSTPLSEPLPPGVYVVKVEVDYGAPTLIVGERSIEVK